MNDTELRERLRDVTREPTGAPDLRPVERRARILRWRRAAAVVATAVVAIAAIALPLSGLQHLGQAPAPAPSPAAEPAFGDGTIGFGPADGWNQLQTNDLSMSVANVAFTTEDVERCGDAGPDERGCFGSTLTSLPPDGILLMAWVDSDRYQWSEPNANFPLGTLPMTFDRSCLADRWETQPNPNIPQCMIWRTIHDRPVEVRLYFGRQNPSASQMADAQAELARLNVSGPASLGSDLAFAPLDGWTDSAGASPAFTPYSERAIAATTANVTLPQVDPDSVYPPGLTNNQIEALPPDGIAIGAEQLLFTENEVPVADYPIRELPLSLKDAKSWTGGGEGLAREDLTHFYVSGSVNGRPIIVQAWFGTTDVTPDLLRQAQRALDQLVVVPRAAPTDAIDQFGISMTVPDGWDALLYQGDPTLIVSTQPISALYWDTSRKTLGPGDVTLTLDESDALVEVQGWAALVGPLTIGPYERCDGCEALDDGAPPTEGHVLYERTFTSGGRAFTLLVEFGSDPTPSQIDSVNSVLSTLTIQPDPSPTETPAPGTTRVGPIYDGEDKPEVTADEQDRRLTWVYEHAEMTLPPGWTGQSYPVVGLERPISLLAAGSWDFTPGGYCGPINALRELPADGAFVWFDGYGTDPPDGITFTSQPSSVSLMGAATDPSPCFGGSAPFVFRWKIGDRYVVAHAALGTDASSETVANAEAALESISVG
jgi:hypothetical protein